MKAQGALPHTLGKEKPSQGCFVGERNRLTAKPKHVGMLRIFRKLRKSCKGTHRRLRLPPALRYPPQRFTPSLTYRSLVYLGR